MPGKAKDGPTSSEECLELYDEMTKAMPADRSKDSERWRIHELLAHLVCFHVREKKPMYWQKFEWLKMTEAELADDPDCLAGLARTKKKPWADKRSYVYEYAFDPQQDTTLGEGSQWIAVDPVSGYERKGSIYTFDETGLLTIRTTQDMPERLSLIPEEDLPVDGIESSIRGVARRFMSSGTLNGPLDTLFRRRAPTLAARASGRPVIEGSDVTAETVRAVAAMKGTLLAIQGPPGAGKTHTGAATIAHLIASGKRVGVTSTSHKVIEHLMHEVLAAAKKQRPKIRAVKVDRDADKAFFDENDVERAASASEVDFDAAQLVGGTAWAFSHPSAVGQLDYLFVDEAGQVSLANLVAVSPSAKNLVLLGDQMQLPQPIKGTHPGDAGRSALEYLLMDDSGAVRNTIPRELGIFLPTTHRMHPDVCKFISDTIYEGRLQPEPVTKERVVLRGKSSSRVPKEAGLCFVPVEHESNVQESEEEVVAIVEIVTELKKRKVQTKVGEVVPLRDEHILVVAPYNRQVKALKEALPKLKVGTVDLFQGQQAPVVILSMCASSADDAPRGLDFLLNRNRMNVAISRAQSLAIIVGSPALRRTRVTSIEQMRLVNLFCRATAD